ncbi:hypothetical protein HID58_081305 [Brassica napus]|uniref:Uncharacterized protein n=1 Tax=Brassica napus TaxID=3708 RepID=A0ABQ7Y7E7_BRANA|nr:hypothetical protein HID58_081305 [Brassica napus]
MSRRRSLLGKEIADKTVAVEDVKGSLPFATDQYPCERINMYSTIDNLLCVRDALNGTEEMALLLRFCFGSLQFWAFEAIPALLKRLGGDDE